MSLDLQNARTYEDGCSSHHLVEALSAIHFFKKEKKTPRIFWPDLRVLNVFKLERNKLMLDVVPIH